MTNQKNTWLHYWKNPIKANQNGMSLFQSIAVYTAIGLIGGFVQGILRAKYKTE